MPRKTIAWPLATRVTVPRPYSRGRSSREPHQLSRPSMKRAMHSKEKAPGKAASQLGRYAWDVGREATLPSRAPARSSLAGDGW